jgi:predicted transposase/invertase (TIGR01784 family)
MDNDIHNIHDKFVRETFSDAERAAAFFEIALPEQLTAQLNLKTLKCQNESYIDSELKEYFSDLIFEVSLKNDPGVKTDVVLLFEHKSSPDKHVLIQVGYYMFAHYFKSIRHGKSSKL